MGKYDWDYWRRLYVKGDDDVTLEKLSLIPGAPSLVSLKRESKAKSWRDQRAKFRYQKEATVSSLVSENQLTKEAIAKVDQLVDAAEVISRHSALAKALQSKVIQRLKTLKPEDLTPVAIAQWIKISTDIERLALGLETERSAVSIEGQVNLEALTDEELEAIARGESRAKG